MESVVYFRPQYKQLGVAVVLELFDVLPEGRYGDGDTVDQRRVDEHDEFSSPVSDNQVVWIYVQHRRQILLARCRVAAGIRLDEVREILLEVVEHLGRRVVWVGNEAEIDNFLGLLVTHEVRYGRRMRGFIEEMLPMLFPSDLGSHRFHILVSNIRTFC